EDGIRAFHVTGVQTCALPIMEARGEVPVVIYHSHTSTEAYPSRTDISYASEPEAHYVLVTTREPDTHEFRSFRIVDGVVTEEDVEVVESYMFSHTGADDVPDHA